MDDYISEENLSGHEEGIFQNIGEAFIYGDYSELRIAVYAYLQLHEELGNDYPSYDEIFAKVFLNYFEERKQFAI